jgi:hypothetical protein
MKHRIFHCLLLCITALGFNTASADITAPEIHKAVVEMAAEIEQVRFIIGRPQIEYRKYVIKDTQPRHLYSVAQSTFARVNQLAGDLAGAQRRNTPPAPLEEITLEDAMTMVGQVRGQLQLIKRALGIDTPVAEVRLNRRADLNDALLVLGDAGRQMNVVIGRNIQWRTFYDQVELAITYVAGALPEAERYPPLPPLEPGKSAPDIFLMIEQVRTAASEVAKKHSVTILRSSVPDEKITLPKLTELEAYDLMTIVLADLAELTLAMEAPDVDRPPYPRPQNIVGSHIYQLLSGLYLQLEHLASG